MPSLLLLIFLFLTWFLWAAVAGQAAVDSARKGTPPHGVSIAPIIPLFPPIAWGLSFILPWGKTIIAVAHLAFALVLIIFIVRYAILLQKHKR